MRDKKEYVSDRLYPDDIPCRLIFAFIEEKAREGDYSKNPFEFKRSWEVDSVGATQQVSREEFLENTIKDLYEKISRLERADERRDSVPGTSRSLFQRLRSSRGDPPSYDESVSDGPEPGPAPPVAKKTIHIKKVELTLNELPVDAIGNYTNLITFPFVQYP